MDKVNLEEKFQLFNDYWNPKIIGELNDSYIKVAKFYGEFTWHKHENEDELIFVAKGSLEIQFREKNIVLNQGEFLIITKGVEHCPKSEKESEVILIEPKTTLNTGDVINEKTVENLQRI